MRQLKVKSQSKPKSIAGAITGMFKESEKELEVVTVGAGALNQAVKGIAIARGFLAPSGVEIVVVPSFSEVEIGGEDKTAICLAVRKQ